MMVGRCFTIMGKTLEFNICGLETSRVANAGIDDLEQRVRDGIPESLQYSCLYWATHLTAANHAAVSQHLLDFFRSLMVLYWLEALSLIGGLRKGLSALQRVASLFEVRTGQLWLSLLLTLLRSATRRSTTWQKTYINSCPPPATR